MGLKNKAITGILWTISQQFSVQIINFVVQILLARLLLPDAFGIIAMLQVFISVGHSLVDSGMTSSLIRTPNLDQKDYSTVFITNLLVSVFIYSVVFVGAPFVERFYEMSDLADVLRVFAIIYIIRALSSVQITRLTKEMKFKAQMLIQIPSVVIAGIIAIVLAYLDFGVWSLVAYNLIQAIISTIQYWVKSNWRPILVLSREKLKTHFGFGYKLTLAGLLNSIYENIYNIVIGKYFSPVSAGFYSRAELFQFFPSRNLSNALEKVTYPMFSKIQDKDDELRKAYRKVMQIVIFVLSPLMMISAVLAEPLFRLILTEKWLPMVPLYQILTIAGVLHPMQRYNLNILRVKGRSDLVLKLNVVKKVVLTVLVAIALPQGLIAMAASQSVFAIVSVVLNTIYSGSLIGYSLLSQLRDVIAIFLVSLGSSILVVFLDHAIGKEFSDLYRLLFGCGLGFVSYFGISFLLRLSPLIEIKAIASHLLQRRQLKKI